MRAIADHGWNVPDDFSIVVIVSSPRVAEMVMPPLTTADAPSAELGRLSIELLIQQLETKEQTILQRLVPCRLVVRGSSGPPRM
jgi:DNA-binding LacI/PurR family transcriptional regulator